MDVSGDKSDVIWKMGTKGLSSITDFVEDGGRGEAPSPFSSWLSKYVVCLCFSSQAARMRHFLLGFNMLSWKC